MSYPYANGVVKAIETRLLDRSRTAKLARTERSGFLKALADAGYGRIVPGDTIESAIARDMKDFHALLDEITPDKKATDLFFLTEDAMNVKILFKRKLFGAPAFDDSGADGSAAFPGLAKAILEGDDEPLPVPLRTLLSDIARKAGGTGAGTLSAIVDRELFGHAFRTIGLFPNDALRTYLRAKADFANVMAMLRMQRLGWSADRLADVFIPGGRYPLALVTEAFSASHADAARLLADQYDEKVSKIVREQTEKRSLSIAETLFADLLLETVEAYRDDGFSIGPIIYYHLEKTREADLIRTLYARAAEDRPAV